MNNKDLNEIAENLEEQKLIKVNPDNPSEVRLTKKGLEEVDRWKERNKEMDFLLFLWEGTSKRLKEIVEKEKDKNEKVSWFKKHIGGG